MGKTVAFLEIAARLKDASIQEVANTLKKKIEAIEKQFGNLKVDDSISKQFDDIIDKMESKFRNVDFTKYTDKFLKSIYGEKDQNNINYIINDYISAFQNLDALVKSQNDVDFLSGLSEKRLNLLMQAVSNVKELKEEINSINDPKDIISELKSLTGYGKDNREPLLYTENGSFDVENIKRFIAYYQKYLEIKNQVENTLESNRFDDFLKTINNDIFSDSEINGIAKRFQDAIDGVLGSVAQKTTSAIKQTKEEIKKEANNEITDTTSSNINTNSEQQKISDNAQKAKKEIEEGLADVQAIIYPRLSDDFKASAEKQIASLEIKGEAIISPKIDGANVKSEEESLSSVSNAEDIKKEASAFGTIESSVTRLKNVIGEKNEAISQEQHLVDVAAANESQRFDQIRENVRRLVTSLEALNNESEVISNLDHLGESFKGLNFSKSFVTNLQGLGNALSDLVPKLQAIGKDPLDFTNLKTIADILPNINIKKSDVTNIGELGSSLKKLQEALVEIEKANNNSYEFLNQISSLLSHSKELENLANILNQIKNQSNTQNIEEEIINAGKAVSTEIDQANTEIKSLDGLLDKVLDLDGQNQKAAQLFDQFGKVKSIVGNIKFGDDGAQTPSVTVKDFNNNQVNFDENANPTSSKKVILDLTSAMTVYNAALKQSEDAEERLSNNSLSTKYKLLYDNLKPLVTEMSSLITENGKFNSLEDAQKFSSVANKAKDLTDQIRGLSSAQKGVTSAQIEKFLSKIYTWMGNNSKAANLLKGTFENLIKTTKELGADAPLTTLEGEFNKITNAAHKAGLEGKSFGNIISDQLTSKAASFVAQFLSIQDVIRYAQQAFQTINELDYALVDLSKTANMSTSQLNDFYLSSSDVAKQMGVTTKEIIDQASAWARLKKIGLLYGDI